MPIPTPPSGGGGGPFAGDMTGLIGALAFGAGTPYKLVGLSGWQAMAAAPLGGAQSLAPKQTRNGSWPLDFWSPSRVVTLALTIEDSLDSFQGSVDALLTATQPGANVTVGVQVGGVYTTVTGQISNRDAPTGLEYPTGYTAAAVEVTCAEARRFGLEVSATTPLPMSTGGLTFPATWPAVWAATSATGVATLANPGNTDGPVWLQINGPVTAPMVTHVGAGAPDVFAYSGSISAGDWLAVDMENRVVLYNGQSSRNNLVTSRGWSSLEPGTNTFAFNASSYSSSASLVVTGMPAWI